MRWPHPRTRLSLYPLSLYTRGFWMQLRPWILTRLTGAEYKNIFSNIYPGLLYYNSNLQDRSQGSILVFLAFQSEHWLWNYCTKRGAPAVKNLLRGLKSQKIVISKRIFAAQAHETGAAKCVDPSLDNSWQDTGGKRANRLHFHSILFHQFSDFLLLFGFPSPELT